MEALVKSCNICWVCSCQTFSEKKTTKCQYLWEGLSYFVYLLHVVTHLWKLQCYHTILVGYGSAYPKLSEITNHQYLWKGLVILLIFCMWLFGSCKISIEATKICYFGLALSGIGSQQIRWSGILKSKNLKTIWVTRLNFCHHWSYRKYSILDYGPKKFLAN